MTTDAAADADPAAVPALRVSGPADLVQAVPYLLGFHPAQSLVLLGLERGRVVVTARIDLADLAEPMLLPGTVTAMRRGGADEFVGADLRRHAHRPPRRSGDGPPLPWAGAAAEVAAAVARVGAVVDDVLLVSRSRGGGPTPAAMPSCCPPEGHAARAEHRGGRRGHLRGSGRAARPGGGRGAARPGAWRTTCRAAAAPRRAERAAVATIVRGGGARAERAVKRALVRGGAHRRLAGPQFDLPDERRRPLRRRAAAHPGARRGVDGGRRPAARRPAAVAPAGRAGCPGPTTRPRCSCSAGRAGAPATARWPGWPPSAPLASDPGYTAADLLLAALSQAIDPRRMPAATAASPALAPIAPAPSERQRAGHHRLGRSEAPVSTSSTAAAHARPSAMAQTTSDAPRVASPQEYTPSAEVCQPSSTTAVPRAGSSLHAERGEQFRHVGARRTRRRAARGRRAARCATRRPAGTRAVRRRGRSRPPRRRPRAPLPSSSPRNSTTSRAHASCTPSSWAGELPRRARRRRPDRVDQARAGLRAAGCGRAPSPTARPAGSRCRGSRPRCRRRR